MDRTPLYGHHFLPFVFSSFASLPSCLNCAPTSRICHMILKNLICCGSWEGSLWTTQVNYTCWRVLWRHHSMHSAVHLFGALPMKVWQSLWERWMGSLWLHYGCIRVALVAEAHEGWGGQSRCVAGTFFYLLYLRYEALGVCASYLPIFCNLWFKVSSCALYKAKKWPLHSAFCCHGFWWWRQILDRAPWLHLRDVKSHTVEHWVYNNIVQTLRRNHIRYKSAPAPPPIAISHGAQSFRGYLRTVPCFHSHSPASVLRPRPSARHDVQPKTPPNCSFAFVLGLCLSPRAPVVMSTSHRHYVFLSKFQ